MMNHLTYHKKLAFWGCLYLLAVIASLLFAGVGHDKPYRGFWIEFGVGMGFAGLAIMGLQFILTARVRSIAAPFGLDELLHFHRQIGFAAALFVVAHVVILFAARPRYVVFLDPGVNAPRAIALSMALILLLLLVVFTVWRKNIRLSYEWWRASHGVFALLIVVIGLAHILMVGFYISDLWKQALWISLTGAAIFMLLYARLFKPLKMMKSPYRISGVKQESDEVYTLELAADGHSGLEFDAGQFVWITLGESPFSMQQHPFTIASSALVKGRYELTIKKLGDFTTEAATAEPGTRAWLEGPYGTFTLKEPAPDYTVLIAGGIGITPMMSILRTARDNGSNRRFLLFYANKHLSSIIFRDELAELENDLNLQVIHVLEEPAPDWDGEHGLVDLSILKRHLPDQPQKDHYYVCGPEPMTDGVETNLRTMNVPVDHLYAERFNIV